MLSLIHIWLTIATVEQAEFSDYIRVIGQVMPSRIIYMDAIEGGRVEERLKEEGAMVKAGDVILRLSNPLPVSYTHLDVYKRQVL